MAIVLGASHRHEDTKKNLASFLSLVTVTDNMN